MRTLFLFTVINALFVTTAGFASLEQTETDINPKAFFESIKGDYHIDSITEGSLGGRIDKASITMDAELPNTAIVSMPFCVADQCFDSGNLFDYSLTKITQVENTYSIELKVGEKKKYYEWSEGVDGRATFRNLQFVGVSGKPGKLTHSLKK